MGASSLDGGEGDDEDSEDGFLDDDEDIDERAEEIAEEVSARVHWRRQVQYARAVLRRRLGMDLNAPATEAVGGVAGAAPSPGGATEDHPHILACGACGVCWNCIALKPLIPVPHVRNKLLEVLGSVTMVCFIDDDVICENHSMTEEIYFFSSGDQDDGGSVKPSGAAGSASAAIFRSGNGQASKLPGSRGTVTSIAMTPRCVAIRLMSISSCVDDLCCRCWTCTPIAWWAERVSKIPCGGTICRTSSPSHSMRCSHTHPCRP